MDRDVYYQKNRQGLWVFKALTDPAKIEMCKLLEVSERLAGDVFMHCPDRDFEFTRRALVAVGLQVEAQQEEKPKPVDVGALTDF
jgi:hypothetical protein